jgi:hypothetical protein
MKGRTRRPSRQTAVACRQPAQLDSTTSTTAAATSTNQVEEEKFQDLVVGLIARYSRYSWSTWLVVKIILKVTTYTVLKVRLGRHTPPFPCRRTIWTRRLTYGSPTGGRSSTR